MLGFFLKEWLHEKVHFVGQTVTNDNSRKTDLFCEGWPTGSTLSS